MTNLTPEEINRVLAEFDGWVPREVTDKKSGETWICFDKDGVTRSYKLGMMPVYTEDLNAIAQIEAKLTDEQQIEYAKRLSVEVPKCMLIADCPPMRDQIAKEAFLVIHATGLQKSTALVRALGLGGTQ